jgi:hypothetical protein
LFLAPACFKGTFKPYAKSVVVMFFRCLLMKTNLVSAYGVSPALRVKQYAQINGGGVKTTLLSKKNI